MSKRTTVLALGALFILGVCALISFGAMASAAIVLLRPRATVSTARSVPTTRPKAPPAQTAPLVPGAAVLDDTLQPTAQPSKPAETNPQATATPTAVSLATAPPVQAAQTPVASPRATAPNNQPANINRPTRIQIPSIGLDFAPVPIGLDNGVPIVTKHDVNWWNGSSLPGKGSNIVFWGHVLRYLQTKDIAAPFENLHRVNVGDEVIVTTDKRYVYVVKEIRYYDDQEISYMLPTRQEQVTLITCSGAIRRTVNGVEMTQRLVVVAVPR